LCPQVLDAVFGFLAMMRQEGPQEWIFKELETASMTAFKFEAQGTASNNVQHLSEHMLKFKPEHYICGRRLHFKYDPDLIKEMLSYIVPERVNLMMLDKKSSQVYDRKEKWFETPYTVKGTCYNWQYAPQ
jgi:secreted Zn-dependent insulinase-like peptidase